MIKFPKAKFNIVNEIFYLFRNHKVIIALISSISTLFGIIIGKRLNASPDKKHSTLAAFSPLLHNEDFKKFLCEKHGTEESIDTESKQFLHIAQEWVDKKNSESYFKVPQLIDITYRDNVALTAIFFCEQQLAQNKTRDEFKAYAKALAEEKVKNICGTETDRPYCFSIQNKSKSQWPLTYSEKNKNLICFAAYVYLRKKQ